ILDVKGSSEEIPKEPPIIEAKPKAKGRGRPKGSKNSKTSKPSTEKQDRKSKSERKNKKEETESEESDWESAPTKNNKNNKRAEPPIDIFAEDESDTGSDFETEDGSTYETEASSEEENGNYSSSQESDSDVDSRSEINKYLKTKRGRELIRKNKEKYRREVDSDLDLSPQELNKRKEAYKRNLVKRAKMDMETMRKQAKKSRIKNKTSQAVKLIRDLSSVIPKYLASSIKKCTFSFNKLSKSDQIEIYEYFKLHNKYEIAITLLLVPKNEDQMYFVRNTILKPAFFTLIFNSIVDL
ncbi:MAG: hypothetical protein RLZZ418_1091, partial [Pseudomonadota bacterium]